MSSSFRIEHDFLGDKQIPSGAYWGVHTARAVENFPISGTPLSAMPELIRAFGWVKKAAARANAELGALDARRAAAIQAACDRLVAGECHDQFVVDVIQGGAGTSTNMNANEVICNLALEKMGHPKAAYDVPNPPLWLDALVAAVPALIVVGFVATMNAYQIPTKDAPQGVPIPVLIWGSVALVLSFIVHRTRFGRYVFAMGGNPEAAALVGIPVRRVTLMLFALLGVLITIAAMVSIARLNAGTNSLGTGMELYVIAAAVIGGTALSGGTGSILGSVLGALIMQSIDSGMLLLDVSIGTRYVIIGQVLIAAVVFDVLYRKWTGDTA